MYRSLPWWFRAVVPQWLFALGCLVFAVCCIVLPMLLEWYGCVASFYLLQENPIPMKSWIIVPGGAMNRGHLTVSFRRRVEAAARLFMRYDSPLELRLQTNLFSGLVFTGGLGESEAARKYAVKEMGVPNDYTLIENASRTTRMNAFFAHKVISQWHNRPENAAAFEQGDAIGTSGGDAVDMGLDPNTEEYQQLLQQSGLPPLLSEDRSGLFVPSGIVLVSDSYHLLRSHLIFRKQFGENTVIFTLASRNPCPYYRTLGALRELGGIVKNLVQGQFTFGELLRQIGRGLRASMLAYTGNSVMSVMWWATCGFFPHPGMLDPMAAIDSVQQRRMEVATELTADKSNMV